MKYPSKVLRCVFLEVRLPPKGLWVSIHWFHVSVDVFFAKIEVNYKNSLVKLTSVRLRARKHAVIFTLYKSQNHTNQPNVGEYTIHGSYGNIFLFFSILIFSSYNLKSLRLEVPQGSRIKREYSNHCSTISNPTICRIPGMDF